jgi:RecB family endonuclease NucS
METDQRYNNITEVLDRVGYRLDHIGKMQDEATKERIAFQREQAKTDKQIKDLNKIRGEYFMDKGEYTEMIMVPSVREMMLEEYGFQFFDRNLESVSPDNKSIQVDAIAWSNGKRNEIVIIEIKTKLKEKHIEDHLNRIRFFDDFFPQFNSLKKTGMIVALEAEPELKEMVNDAGFYYASFKDDFTKMKNRKGFEP